MIIIEKERNIYDQLKKEISKICKKVQNTLTKYEK